MLLRMKDISKSFGATKVLDAVNFDVQKGEIVALLGANGAGKSTLMKIMTGIYQKDDGSTEVSGELVEIETPLDAMSHGLRLVPQELQIVPHLSIAENIFLGNWPAHGAGPLARVNRTELKEKAKAILADLGITDLDVLVPLSRLSVSEQRLVEIARSLAGDARILVMDEPTASLSAPECDRLFSILDGLRKRGVSIIFISHFLDEVFRICDRIEVLRDGRNAGSFITSKTDHHAVLTAMLGRELNDLFPGHARNKGAQALAVTSLSASSRISDLSFSVRKGEIHGLFGLIGSGIEEIGKVLFGEKQAKSGMITLFEKPLSPHSVANSIAAGIGFVSGERKSEGIVPELPLTDNATLPFLSHHVRGWTTSVVSQTDFTRKWIDALGVITSGPKQKIRSLSGGNQQKICIARWLVDDLKVLILEEPTRGVDLGARKDIYRHLRELSDRGLAIIVISSDAEEIGGLADSSTVLIAGQVVARFDQPVDAHTLMQSATHENAA